jgi:hypothetical protein
MQFMIARPAGFSLMRRLALATMVLVCLTACSPRYNWRVVQGNDAFSVTFPAHVAHETRPINLAGTKGSMTMYGAEVAHVTFAVGVATFPTNSDLSGVTQLLANDMAHALNGAAPALNEVPFVLQGSGDHIRGSSFEINSASTQVRARIAVHAGHLVEVLVAGPPDAFRDKETSQARDTFFQSLTLY